ncbi:phosphonate ABC transporter ATP-binding protein [Oceanobacillus damuensis]|uniref:phosphonate ABC transporter ATP-binding protein n=1 Tax=Oceanobacillus damuensis TaxID=937928 RepID=UPI000832A203|nr:phosphonate ABC transporter ATP-binding protein [Oceanobacillus damuensis]
MENESILVLKNIQKTYKDGTAALKKINLSITKGQVVSIIGPSGSGKSTLIRCINRLVEPTSGAIEFEGKEIMKLRGKSLRKVRSKIGMVFQSHNLIKRAHTIQNVLHGRLGYTGSIKGSLGMFEKRDVEVALSILNRVGIEEFAYKRADELSGGQQQRVGIARAICQKPSIIMADEPIASLDPSASRTVMEYLRNICKEDGITAIINLHQVEFAKEFSDRIVAVKSGEIVFDGTPDELMEAKIFQIYN